MTSLHVDADRWRGASAVRPRRAARATGPRAGRQGQRLRLRQHAARRRGGRARADPRSPSAPSSRCAEVAGTATTATSSCSTPFEPARRDAAATPGRELAHGPHAARVVRTVASRDAWHVARDGPGPVRVVLEALTSMRRFGLAADELAGVLADARRSTAIADGRVRSRASPCTCRSRSRRRPPVDPGARWHDAVAPAPPPARRRVRGARLGPAGARRGRPVRRVPVASTVTASTGPRCGSATSTTPSSRPCAALPDIALCAAHRHPAVARRPRRAAGPRHRARRARRARGQASGYRQRRALARRRLVVVAAGPRTASRSRRRGRRLERPPARRRRRHRRPRGRRAARCRRSTSAGKQRWFAEPPHMQVARSVLPRGMPLPAVGDELDVDVRFTTIHLDASSASTDLRRPVRPAALSRALPGAEVAGIAARGRPGSSRRRRTQRSGAVEDAAARVVAVLGTPSLRTGSCSGTSMSRTTIAAKYTVATRCTQDRRRRTSPRAGPVVGAVAAAGTTRRRRSRRPRRPARSGSRASAAGPAPRAGSATARTAASRPCW